jgi:hypothetical protein
MRISDGARLSQLIDAHADCKYSIFFSFIQQLQGKA